MYCHPANNVLQYDGAYWIRTNKAMPFRVLAHQCYLTRMPQIEYDELPRVLLLRRMHSAFLAVRGLDTAYCYYSPRKGSLTTEFFAINNCR